MDSHIPQVIQVLDAAGSSVESVRVPASTQLLNYFKEPGFASILGTIISKRNEIDSDMRLRAALNLKMLVRQYWVLRPDSDYCVSDDEKSSIRESIATLLGDDRQEIGVSLAITIANIAKHDFPSLWPELLTDLLTALLGSSDRHLRFLPTLYHTVKVIATLHDTPEYNEFDTETELSKIYDLKVDHLRDFSPTIVMNLVTIWGKLTQRLVSQIGEFLENPTGASTAVDPLLAQECLYAFKILDVLLRSFLPSLHACNNNFVVEFCTMIVARLEVVSDICKVTQNYPGASYVGKLYLRMIKFIVKLQELHPLTFNPVLLPFLNYFLREFLDWKDEWRGSQLMETPLIMYMTFISNIIGCRAYRESYLNEVKINTKYNDPDIEIPTEEAIRTGHHIVSTFFTDQTLVGLLQTIIERYLKFQEDRMEVWETDPEEFLAEDLTENSFTIRHTAEFLFYRLLSYNEDLMCEEVVRLIQQVRMNCEKENWQEVTSEEILLKAACMETLSLGYITLSQNGIIDYVQIQDEMFEFDLTHPDPRYRVIRRCIAVIIGQWTDDIPQELHKKAYEILVTLLADSDTLVRYYALISINNLISSMDLDYEPYGSCIRPNVEYVLAFLREMQNSSFARLILLQLSRLTFHLADRIAPFSEAIVQHCQEFWNISEQRNERELKTPIVDILASLCESLPDYRIIYPVFIDIIVQTTDLNTADSELLLEQGMRLWWNLIQTSDNLTDDLSKLFPRLLHIYSKVPHEPHTVSLTIRLLESYMILGGAQFCEANASIMIELMDMLISGKHWDLLLSVLDLFITLVQIIPISGPQMLCSCLSKAYTCLFYRFPKRTKLVHKVCTLFMHILIKNTAFFFEFLEDDSLNSVKGEMDLNAPRPLIRLVSRFLDMWRLLDFIEPEKVWSCGFAVLFSANNPTVNEVAPQLLDAIASLVFELKKKLKTTESRRRATEHSDVIAIKDSTVYVLRKKLKDSDVSKAPMEEILNFIIQRVSQTIQTLGEEYQQQILAAIEDQTRAFLQEHM